MNSREKGKRGERQWRDELRANGYAARRGQQFRGSPDSPDVVCDSLPWIHFEVKAVERLNIVEAMEQARRDCAEPKMVGDGPRGPDERSGLDGRGLRKVAIVAHRRSFRPWLVTMEAETFFRLLRGELASQARLEMDAPNRKTASRNEVTDGNGANEEKDLETARSESDALPTTKDSNQATTERKANV